ncbi:sugar ABC transporter permease [Paenibacillus sp.]|uniref:carbohydrate ABC transporter permease n=1 Tax=Paenibacillus sp. TaxID=58172 RepID=UPI002D553E20|nr:sugar ABC transporter permease [Paenibacillus sp.]HZG58856.1 sugar ABC transporter permease [Paenibacillus sp.]
MRKVIPYSYGKQEEQAALGFILPATLLLILFIFYPMFRAFVMSFQNVMLLSNTSTFVGLTNYVNLVQDPFFIRSIKNSLYFAVVVIPVQTVIALGLALLIRGKFKGIGIFRTVYFLPVVVSFAIAATIFKLIYNKDYGFLNIILQAFGFPGVEFLSNPDTAMIGIIILCLWKSMGLFMVIFLAGLNNISDSYYEAAQIDGASKIKQFFYVTLPLLQRTIGFVIIITTMDALKIFVPIYVTTSGGPAGATTTVVYYIYETAFDQMNIGYASAAAFLFFVAVLLISLIQLRVFRSDVEY